MSAIRIICIVPLLFAPQAFGHRVLVVGTVDASQYVSFSFAAHVGQPATLVYTVPNDKHFVLTDLVGYGGASTDSIVIIHEGSTEKLRARLGGAHLQYTFKAGLVFQPGQTVTVSETVVSTSRITLSGYLY